MNENEHESKPDENAHIEKAVVSNHLVVLVDIDTAIHA